MLTITSCLPFTLSWSSINSQYLTGRPFLRELISGTEDINAVSAGDVRDGILKNKSNLSDDDDEVDQGDSWLDK